MSNPHFLRWRMKRALIFAKIYFCQDSWKVIENCTTFQNRWITSLQNPSLTIEQIKSTIFSGFPDIWIRWYFFILLPLEIKPKRHLQNMIMQEDPYFLLQSIPYLLSSPSQSFILFAVDLRFHAWPVQKWGPLICFFPKPHNWKLSCSTTFRRCYLMVSYGRFSRPH